VKNLPAACVGVLVAACLVGNANGGGGSIGEDAGARSTVNGAAEVQVTATAGKVPTADPDNPCGGPGPEPSAAYRLPAYTTGQLAAMMRPPATLAQLLSNLKEVLDRNLLAQPAFFDDAVLRRVFNATGVRWVEPGTRDVAFDHAIRPTRAARIIFSDGPFAGMKVDVGMSHRCLNRHADRNNPGSIIAPHTYDSGYVRIRLEESAGLTLGAVRQVFGPGTGGFDASCKEPAVVSYDGPDQTGADAFLLNSASFVVRPDAYSGLCQSQSRRALPDEYPVIDVNIRVLEQDFTQWSPALS